MTKDLTMRYSPAAELANTLTHGVGAVLSVVGLCFLVGYASVLEDAYRIVSVSVFGATMVALYLTSTLYHAARHPTWKQVLRIFDHACIYLLIAGTYTPFTLVALRGGWGWSLFGVTWGLALSGIVFKVFFMGRLEKLSVLCYVGMGWLGVIAVGPVVSALPTPGIFWLVTGGVMYTLGVIFYAWKRFHYHHAIWHLFVMAGTFSHFVSIYYYVLPIS